MIGILSFEDTHGPVERMLAVMEGAAAPAPEQAPYV